VTIITFAGVQVDNVTYKEALLIAKNYIALGSPKIIVTPNPEIIVNAQHDDELKHIINSADLKIPDGISMVVVSKLLGCPLKERVAGIDLMTGIIEESANHGWKIFLLGGEPGIAEEAAKKLNEQYPGLLIAGCHHGYFKMGDDESIIKMIVDAKPDVLFVGLGGGRQEKWANRHLKELNVPLVMTVGGSMDVISGRKKRAPKWTRKICIEWLYRLLTEPHRWKRQLALPKFLWLMFILRR
jgi:N-acetylglucosaminyldiphosphoundecaprenol N-acetyl-beta-D-mannosaminyltransferase